MFKLILKAFVCQPLKKLLYFVFLIAVIVGGTNNANAQFNFGTPTNLGSTVNSQSDDTAPSISADGLSLFFDSFRSGGSGGQDLWVTTRATISDPWGTPVNLGTTVNSSSHDAQPNISSDGLSLYFSSTRDGVPAELWVTTRLTISDPWGAPVRFASPSSWGGWSPNISSSDLNFYFASNRTTAGGGVLDLWMYTRSAISDPWPILPAHLGTTVNSSSFEIGPSISTDELILLFASDRSGGEGDFDIWMTSRTNVSDPFGSPMNLGSTVNSSSTDEFPNFSSDGQTLYFGSNRTGGVGNLDLWQVATNPTAIDEIAGELPTTFSLLQNYPNPFNPSTLIKYSVPENSFVKLSVYNLVGEEVSVLVNKTVNAGFYEVSFNATNLPSGTYFYRLQSGNTVQAKKMILLK